MATRREIREAFYSDLEVAVSNHLDPDDINQEQGEQPEDLPSLVHKDDYRKVPMNQGSAAPTRVRRDTNDDAEAELYGTMHEAVFSCKVESDDEQIKEDIYEALRTYFEKYEHPAWDASDIQSDVAWVRVVDSTSEDDVDHEPIARGDRLEIRLTFQREIENTGTAIQSVDSEVDADNDGTTEFTFTST